MLPQSIATALLITNSLYACGTDPKATAPLNGADAGTAAKASPPRAANAAEPNYLANPRSVTALGLRSYWQTKIPHSGAAPLAGMSLDGGEIFSWDHLGVVTRIKPDTGGVLWQGSTQSPLDKIYGVNIFPAGSTPAAIALTDAASIVFEDGSGALIGQQSLRRVPATAGSTNGNFVVYGDSEGRIIWLRLAESNIANLSTKRPAPGEYDTGEDRSLRRTVVCLEEFGAMTAGKVMIPPVVVPNGGVLAVSTGGEVSLFNAANAKPLWRYASNAPFVSTPAILNGIAYVAGKDQYLHAIDLRTGQDTWKWFTQSPLTNPPLAADDLVLLQVPEEGLVAFSTSPGDHVSGLVKWKSKAAGNAVTRTADGFILWDDASRTMTLVEPKAGGITASACFPEASWVASTAPVNGSIMMLSMDGRMQQLRPIEPMKSATPAPADRQTSTADAGTSPTSGTPAATP
jgi:outer membrane protein assembly factor BamB